MTKHELKVQPQFWDALASGANPSNIRCDDRKFRVGDTCILKRYDPSHGFTGQSVEKVITHILMPEDFPNGLPVGYVILGFGELGEMAKFQALLNKRMEAKKGDDRVEAYALKLELNAMVMRLQRDGFDVGFEDDEKLNPPC